VQHRPPPVRENARTVNRPASSSLPLPLPPRQLSEHRRPSPLRKPHLGTEGRIVLICVGHTRSVARHPPSLVLPANQPCLTPAGAATTGNSRFASSAKLLVKTPTLLAKAFPTGFSSSCWERTVGVLSDGKELFANRNAGPVGKASPTATCTVGKGGAPSTQLPLPSPTGKRRLLAKSGWQRERQLCQQLGLPTASVHVVGKSAGQGCWQRTQLCQQHGPKLLAKPARGSGGKPSFANSLS
jgi:hypothetical protein